MIKNGFNRKYMLMLIDALLTFIAYLCVARGTYFVGNIFSNNFWQHAILIVICMSMCRFFFKVYNCIWRYADASEYLYLATIDIIGIGVSLFINYILYKDSFPELSILFTCVLSFTFLLLSRICYKQFYTVCIKRQNISDGNGKTHVAIIGAGLAASTLLNELTSNTKSTMIPYCFFDDDDKKIGRKIKGYKVKGNIKSIPRVLKGTRIKTLVLAISTISPERKKEIIDYCTKNGFKVKIYEYAFERIAKAGNYQKPDVRDVKIEDLLFRSVVKLKKHEASEYIKNKTVLVTGGGGSIGSELCRQISDMEPKNLIILDIYENTTYYIQQEIKKKYPKLNLFVEIASVRDEEKINAIFEKYKPQIVFHAAAHKHVPLMEDCGDEAIKNNVFGTLNVANAAEKYGVSKMLLISTDKAVNPTNIMGATKRLCEMIIQSKNNSKTVFVAVRFGNVLGSSGSVIPLFKKQIKEGGPVTITDKRITRYFMTIPEAVSLVLQTGTMAEKSEIFILDMGNPIKILDLAENMITLSGLTPYKDIDIKEIGLRPGEKLYEELLIKTEECDKTSHDKIFVERDNCISPEELNEKLEILSSVINSHDKNMIKEAIKKVVPTYHEPEEVNEAYCNK